MFRISQLKVVIGTVCTAFLLLGSASAARAQGFISPFIGFNFAGDSGCRELSGCEDKNLNIGVGAGALGNVFGGEVEFGYAKNFFGEIPGFSSNVVTLMGNAMLAPKMGPVRPFALAGVGLMKSRAELTGTGGVLDADNNQLGWNVGGGVMGFFGESVGLRGDIRYFHSFQNLPYLSSLSDQKLHFARAAVGLVFKF